MKPRFDRCLLLCAALAAAGCASSGAAPGAPPPVRAAAGGRAAPAANAPSIVLDARSAGPVVSSDVYGASLDTWYDFTQPFVNPSLQRTGIHLVRFPGGSESDLYHWENGGSLCDPKQGYILPQSTFDNLMTAVAAPVHLDVAITLNYGSNRTCNGGGDPTEAAAWVAYAKSKGYRVAYWTVGNEEYGSWEYDLHQPKHDPVTYAGAVRTGYYPDVKQADPTVKLGVVVDGPHDKKWNDVVLRDAGPFDFVELHYYPQYDTDSDSFLLGYAIDHFAHMLASLRREMTADGVPATVPIYLGEYNNDAGNEGKQSVSIVNGLYLGQMIGTLQNAGVPMATWWLAYGSCDQNGDQSSALYGWQNFGSEALFSDGLPEYGCSTAPRIAGGTSFPPARVMALYARFVPGGSQVRTTTIARSLTGRVRAYGYAVGSGYVVMLFNDTLSTIAATVRVRNASANSFSATLSVYGKSQYDRSRANRWTGAVTHRLGTVSSNVPLELAPYSVSALSLH
jgi:hypothetical protein